MLLLSGCSKGSSEESTARGDFSAVKSTLRKARRSHDPQSRIALLRSAYENFQTLEARWAGFEKIPSSQKKYVDKLLQVPLQVYGLSMQTGDLDAFKWALARSVPLDTQYAELLKFWKLGRDWQDFILSKDPSALSIFMDMAVKENNAKFFNRHVGAFKASGYKVVFPLEKTEFNARFCRYIANRIDRTMRRNDTEELRFLIGHMPPLAAVVHIDWKTKETMQALGPYVCMELKDEALACKLVDLGYDMNRIDLAQTGFDVGGPFFQSLEAHPEYAVVHVLRLGEWVGSLSPEETAFLLAVPESALRPVNDLHIDEAIESSVRSADLDNAVRLIRFREQTRPLTRHDYDDLLVWALESGSTTDPRIAIPLIHLREKTYPLTHHDYDKLLGWALEFGNTAVFDYVRQHSEKIDLFSINLNQLAGSPKLFVLYAPQIMQKIYPTMDRKPRRDGTTYGRIQALFSSHHPRAVLYIVRKYDLGENWKVVTDGRTLLMDVCEGGNLEAARYLVEQRGEDVRAHTGYIEITTSIFGRNRAKEGRLTPMFFAAKGDRDGRLIRYLASKLGSVNARSGFGATPLMHAVDSGNLVAAKTLIALGANVNARMNENLTSQELAGMGNYEEISTAYRRALKTGNQAMIQLLKEAGARP